jgi:hypothetical protein
MCSEPFRRQSAGFRVIWGLCLSILHASFDGGMNDGFLSTKFVVSDSRRFPIPFKIFTMLLISKVNL